MSSYSNFESFKQAVNSAADTWLEQVNEKTNYDKAAFGNELYKTIENICKDVSTITDEKEKAKAQKYIFRSSEFGGNSSTEKG